MTIRKVVCFLPSLSSPPFCIPFFCCFIALCFLSSFTAVTSLVMDHHKKSRYYFCCPLAVDKARESKDGYSQLFAWFSSCLGCRVEDSIAFWIKSCCLTSVLSDSWPEPYELLFSDINHVPKQYNLVVVVQQAQLCSAESLACTMVELQPATSVAGDLHHDWSFRFGFGLFLN